MSRLQVECMLGTESQSYQSSVCWEHSVKVTSRVYVRNREPKLPVECMLGTQCQGYKSSVC